MTVLPPRWAEQIADAALLYSVASRGQCAVALQAGTRSTSADSSTTSRGFVTRLTSTPAPRLSTSENGMISTMENSPVGRKSPTICCQYDISAPLQKPTTMAAHAPAGVLNGTK